jgi:hypothetical protein
LVPVLRVWPVRSGGRLQERTHAESTEIGIKGRSTMTKAELAKALRDH